MPFVPDIDDKPIIPVLTDKPGGVWKPEEEKGSWIPDDAPVEKYKPSGYTGSWKEPSTISRVAWNILKSPYVVGKYAFRALTFPFEAVEKTIGSPLAPVVKDITMFTRDPEQAVKMMKQLPSEMGAGFKAGFKSWIPGHPDEKETADFVKVFRIYADTLTGDATSPGVVTEREYTPYEKAYLETGAQLGGFGTSFLVVPSVLSKVYRAIRSGVLKAKPLLGIKEKLFALEVAKTELAAEKAVRIDKVTKLAQETYLTDMKSLAAEVSKETGLNVTPKAVSYRLYQLSGGMGQKGVTTIKALDEVQNPIIKEFQTLTKEYKELGILGDITYNQKLTKLQLTAILRRKAESLGIKLKPKEATNWIAFEKRLQERIVKLSEPSYQKVLLKTAQKLTPDVTKQKVIQNRLLDVLIKTKAKGKELSAKISEQLLDSAIEIRTGSPLSKKIASLLDFAPGDKRLTTLGNRILALEKLERGARNKEANKILKIAKKINPQVSKYTQDLISKMLPLIDKIEDTKIIGKIPLIKKILSMKREFPGKAAKIKEVQDVLDEVRLEHWVEDLYGGSPYLPRMYEIKEGKLVERLISLFRPTKITPIRRRELYLLTHPEARKELKEITQIEYPVIKKLLEGANNVANAKFFEQISKDSSMAVKLEGAYRKGAWQPAIAGWKEIPDEKAFGKLRGMFVQPQIYHYVMDLKTVPGVAEKYVDKWLSVYKIGKVALSPSVQAHNIGGDFLLEVASGVDELHMPGIRLQMLKDIRSNSPKWQQFLTWMKGQSYFDTEIFKDILSPYKSTKSGINKYLDYITTASSKVWQGIVKYPEKFWRNHELRHKAIIYYDRLNKGDEPAKAFQYALKWGINYSDLSQFEKRVVRRIMPFYSFPRHSIPLVLEAFAERPYAMAKYAMLPKLVTQYSLNKLKISEDDWKSIQKDLPDYVKNNSYMLLPYRDVNGDLRLWDWSAFLPWQVIGDAQERGILKTVFTNPIYQIVSDISHKKSSWSGQPIYLESDTDTEKFAKKVAYWWSMLAPSLATKKYFWDRMYQAFTGQTVKGKIVPLEETLLQTMLGLRTIAVDAALNKRLRIYEKQETYKELIKKLSNAALAYSRNEMSAKDFERNKAQLIEQLKELTE